MPAGTFCETDSQAIKATGCSPAQHVRMDGHITKQSHAQDAQHQITDVRLDNGVRLHGMYAGVQGDRDVDRGQHAVPQWQGRQDLGLRG